MAKKEIKEQEKQMRKEEEMGKAEDEQRKTEEKQRTEEQHKSDKRQRNEEHQKTSGRQRNENSKGNGIGQATRAKPQTDRTGIEKTLNGEKLDERSDARKKRKNRRRNMQKDGKPKGSRGKENVKDDLKKDVRSKTRGQDKKSNGRQLPAVLGKQGAGASGWFSRTNVQFNKVDVKNITQNITRAASKSNPVTAAISTATRVIRVAQHSNDRIQRNVERG